MKASTLGVVSVALILGWGYPFLLYGKMKRRACRWIQNDPVTGLFLPFIFPVIVYKYFSFVNWGKVFSLNGKILLCDVILLSLLALGVRLIWKNAAVTGRVFPPYLLKSRHDACRADNIHLVATEALRQNGPTGPTEKYTEFFTGRWDGTLDLLRKGGLLASVDLVVNLFVVLTSIFMVWYQMPLVVTRTTLGEAEYNDLILCAELVGFWFPLRLYSDWYLTFFRFGSIPARRLAAFWTLLLLYLEGIALVIANGLPGGFPLTLGSLQAGTAVLLGLISLLKPGVFRAFALGYVETASDYYPAVVLIVFVVIATLVLRAC